MLAEDPTAVLSDIAKGKHEVSKNRPQHDELTLINGLFHRAAAHISAHASLNFQHSIREVAIMFCQKGYPNTCSEYVMFVNDQIFRTLV